MNKIPRSIAFYLVFFFFFCSFVCCEAGDSTKPKEGDLSKARYVDPKGYFTITPPVGWRLQEYPQDTRGKVAFFGPESNVDLRVLVSEKDYSSFKELFQHASETAKDMDRQYGAKVSLEKITFLGRPAVKRSFVVKDVRCFAIEFMEKNIRHDIQYAAPNKAYEKYLPIVLKAMDTYEPAQKDLSRETQKSKR